MTHTLLAWDQRLFHAINGMRNDLLETVLPIVSYTWLLWLLGCAAFAFWIIKSVRAGTLRKQIPTIVSGLLFILLSVGVTELGVNATKYCVSRERPYHVQGDMFHLTADGWKYNPPGFRKRAKTRDSFVSGHAAQSMTVAVAAAMLCPPLSPVIYAMPLFVGYSRLFLGKHYPSDVICGWILGALAALAVRRVMGILRRKLAASRTGPPSRSM